MINKIELVNNYDFIGAKITNSYKHTDGQPHIELWLTDTEFARTGIRKPGATSEVWQSLRKSVVKKRFQP